MEQFDILTGVSEFLTRSQRNNMRQLNRHYQALYRRVCDRVLLVRGFDQGRQVRLHLYPNASLEDVTIASFVRDLPADGVDFDEFQAVGGVGSDKSRGVGSDEFQALREPAAVRNLCFQLESYSLQEDRLGPLVKCSQHYEVPFLLKLLRLMYGPNYAKRMCLPVPWKRHYTFKVTHLSKYACFPSVLSLDEYKCFVTLTRLRWFTILPNKYDKVVDIEWQRVKIPLRMNGPKPFLDFDFAKVPVITQYLTIPKWDEMFGFQISAQSTLLFDFELVDLHGIVIQPSIYQSCFQRGRTRVDFRQSGRSRLIFLGQQFRSQVRSVGNQIYDVKVIFDQCVYFYQQTFVNDLRDHQDLRTKTRGGLVIVVIRTDAEFIPLHTEITPLHMEETFLIRVDTRVTMKDPQNYLLLMRYQEQFTLVKVPDDVYDFYNDYI